MNNETFINRLGKEVYYIYIYGMIIPLMSKSISFTFLYCVIGMIHILINLYHLLNAHLKNKEI